METNRNELRKEFEGYITNVKNDYTEIYNPFSYLLNDKDFV